VLKWPNERLRPPALANRCVLITGGSSGIGADVLVSNAGVGWYDPFASMTESEVDSLLDLNLRAAAHLVHAALS
jgi:NAD(P)-dependent dehydrogenase (short-subunit alcohol dehydrogenase family)